MTQKKNSVIMIVTILLVAFFYHFFNYKYPKEKQIVGIVNDQQLFYSDFETFADKMDIEINENTRNFILDNLIAQKVILEFAEISGIREKELQPVFDKQKEVITLNLIAERFFDYQTYQYIKVSNRELKEYYRNHLFYKIRAMNFPKNQSSAYDNAMSALRRLNEGEYFVDVYSDVFPDDTGKNPGLVGLTDLEDATDSLKYQIQKLKNAGDFSGIAESKNYYSIYYRDKTPSFSESKDYIYKKLYYLKKENERESLYRKINDSITLNYYAINKMLSDSLSSYNGVFKDYLAVSTFNNQKLEIPVFLEKIKQDYGVYNIFSYNEKEVQQFVHSIILQQVVLDYADKVKFKENPFFKKELSRKLKQMEEKMAEETISYIISQYLKIEDPSINEIQDEYRRNNELYRKPSLFKVQEIYLKRKSQADKVLEMAKKGYDFNQLVQTYSVNEEKEWNFGKTPYLDSNDLGREYRLFEKYKKGDVMELREDLEGHYIVTKILDVQAGALPDMNNARNEVISRINSRKISEKLEDICNEYSIHTRKYYENLIPRKKMKTRKLPGFK
ncbi:MAG TPA: peptidylprolyl isomerase [Candidatus Cloacimonadota bacterium]|nr:peptidylprolyl isomerase [Candidatus Cloacimonadota bacterium]